MAVILCRCRRLLCGATRGGVWRRWRQGGPQRRCRRRARSSARRADRRGWAAQTFEQTTSRFARARAFLLQKVYQEGTSCAAALLCSDRPPGIPGRGGAGSCHARRGPGRALQSERRRCPPRSAVERNAVSRQDYDHAVASAQAATGQVEAARAALRRPRSTSATRASRVPSTVWPAWRSRTSGHWSGAQAQRCSRSCRKSTRSR
jgi:hypothetical protein